MLYVLMRNPATKETQELLEWELVRRSILLDAGWEEVPNVARYGARVEEPDSGVAPAAITGSAGGAAIEGVTVRIDDDLVVLAPGEQPAAQPGFRLVEVSTHGSEMQEFIQVPDDAPAAKRRKRGA